MAISSAQRTAQFSTEREGFSGGQFNSRQMSAALTTQTDVLETARQTLHTRDLDKVESAILERNGQVSLIRKKTPRAE
jgi:uncharacterized membrane protein YcaP (DUF421 family)